MSDVKTLPSSPETEADVLGSCMAEGEIYWRIVEQMGGDKALELFHSMELRMVAKAIKAVLAAKNTLVMSSVVDELAKNPASERLVPSPAVFVHQLQVRSAIRNRTALRDSISGLIEQRSTRAMLLKIEELGNGLADGTINNTAASGQLRDISLDGGSSTAEPPVLGDLIQKLEKENSIGVPWRAKTGIRALDKVFNGGYEPRRLYIVGARPKVGKSMILFNGALEALATGCTVLFVSMELSETELWTKMLSSYSMIPQRDLQDVFDKKRKLSDLPVEQQTDYLEASEELGRAKLHTMFVQHVRDGVDSIVAAAMALRLKYGDDEPIVVFVDYIQLLVKSGATKREDIEDASRKLKLSALEFSLCVVAAAQVNRASASNEDGMPRAYMLRDSGSLEQDADIVMMLNRPILQDETASPELMNIFVELNRTGPSQQWIDAKFLPEYQQLTDLNYDDDDEEKDADYDEPRTSSRTSREQAEPSITFDDDQYDDEEPRASRPRRRDSDDDDDARRSSRRERRSATADDDEYV